jgi:hypothetical protein
MSVLVCVGIVLGQSRSDHVHFRAGLLERDSGLEPCNRIQTALAATLAVGIGEASLHRHPQTRFAGEVEPGGHHSEHSEGLSIQSNSLAHDTRIASETALPNRVAEHHYRRPARLVFLSREHSAHHRLDSQYGKYLG